VAPAPPGDPQPRGRHPQHRPGELDHVRDPPDPHRRRPLRAGEPGQPRPLPRRGATVVVGLIPYEQGSGGQARIFASW
jgi:hypothetical protein